MKLDLPSLRRRLVEIDYQFRHRHLPGSLSALPIIAGIFEQKTPDDIFILSKGHSCAALYAVLEAVGYSPNLALVHPERDVANGVHMTAGSLGHGLPFAAGIAWARRARGLSGRVHVLLGDGECLEGTTWEGLHLAAALQLHDRLIVHLDDNGYQGSDPIMIPHLWEQMQALFPVVRHQIPKGCGIRRFEENPVKSVHLVTEQDFAELMEELA